VLLISSLTFASSQNVKLRWTKRKALPDVQFIIQIWVEQDFTPEKNTYFLANENILIVKNTVRAHEKSCGFPNKSAILHSGRYYSPGYKIHNFSLHCSLFIGHSLRRYPPISTLFFTKHIAKKKKKKKK
jgi:hypothetical protein